MPITFPIGTRVRITTTRFGTDDKLYNAEGTVAFDPRWNERGVAVPGSWPARAEPYVWTILRDEDLTILDLPAPAEPPTTPLQVGDRVQVRNGYRFSGLRETNTDLEFASPFQVGDRVRTLRESYDQWPAGICGTVVRIPNAVGVCVALDGPHSLPGCDPDFNSQSGFYYRNNDLAPVSTAPTTATRPIQVGDTVQLHGSGYSFDGMYATVAEVGTNTHRVRLIGYDHTSNRSRDGERWSVRAEELRRVAPPPEDTNGKAKPRIVDAEHHAFRSFELRVEALQPA